MKTNSQRGRSVVKLDSILDGEEKKTYNQTQKITKNRNRLCNDPCNDPIPQSQSNPSTGPKQTALMHDIRSPENPNIDILDSHMAQNNTPNNNGWNSNAVGDLAQDRPGGAQRRRCHTITGVAVDHSGGNSVQENLEALLHAERFGEVFRVLHFRNKTEVAGVTAVGEDDVGDSSEAVDKACVLCNFIRAVTRTLNGDANHGDQNG